MIHLSELKAIVRLGVPIVIGQLGNVLMGVGDTVQVGRLGASPVAASGFANALYWLVSIVGIGSMMVLATQVAAAQSRRDFAECNRILRSAVVLGWGWGLLIGLVYFVLTFFFGHFKQKPDVVTLAVGYGHYVALSAVPQLMYVALRQFADGLSFTRVSMIITLAGTALDIFLNWVFIHGKFGVPAMGLNGAGLTTVISRTLMAVGMALWIWRGRIFSPYRIAASSLPIRPLVRKLFRMGLPGGLQLFFEIAAFSSATVLAGWLGTVQQAAHSIALNMASVTYMVASGISSAGAIRVGQAVGLESRVGVRRAGATATLMAAIFMGGACLLFLALSRPLAHLYTSQPDLIAVTASLVVIAGFFQLSDGLQVTGLGILRGIADVNVPTYITLLAYWGIGLPSGYLMAFLFKMDVQGIWYGLSLGLTVSAVLLLLRFYRITGRSSFVFRHTTDQVTHG